MKRLITMGLAVVAVAWALSARAEQSREDLAKESEAACAESAKDGAATPAMIVKKAKEAAALVAKQGRAAFPKFKGKDSPFIFGGTYIWIHNLDGQMLMHPIKPGMEGKVMLNLRDKNGKFFFVEMNKMVTEKGSGWSEYVWPKPGEKDVSPKISFVQLVKHGGESFVLGCGAYDITLEDVKKAGVLE